MSTRTSYAHGIPSWVDLSTPDVDAARAFYGELLGWDYQENPTDGGPPYYMATKDGHNAAGMMQQDPAMAGMPPIWSSYVNVDDVDAVVAGVEGAGGQVMVPPMDVMEHGRMAIVIDPTGAMLGLWQPRQHIGASIVNEPGAFCWSELISPDVPRAAAFYNAILGWEAEASSATTGMDYTEFKVGGESIAGAMPPPMEGIPPFWGVYFAVADCDATIARTQELGGSLVNGPIDVPIGRFAVLSDPQGGMFNVIALNEPQ